MTKSKAETLLDKLVKYWDQYSEEMATFLKTSPVVFNVGDTFYRDAIDLAIDNFTEDHKRMVTAIFLLRSKNLGQIVVTPITYCTLGVYIKDKKVHLGFYGTLNKKKRQQLAANQTIRFKYIPDEWLDNDYTKSAVKQLASLISG